MGITSDKLDEIGVFAESLGFEYSHNADKTWAIYVSKQYRCVCVAYVSSLVKDHTTGIYLEFLPGDKVRYDTAHIISNYMPDALKIMEKLREAEKE